MYSLFRHFLVGNESDMMITDDMEEYYIKRLPISEKQRRKEEEGILILNQKNEEYQKSFVKIALIKKSLNQATMSVMKVVVSLVDRGETLDSMIEKTEDLESSSKIFYQNNLPWYRRWRNSIFDYLKYCATCMYFCFYHQRRSKAKKYTENGEV